jgi:hypothetical protein
LGKAAAKTTPDTSDLATIPCGVDLEGEPCGTGYFGERKKNGRYYGTDYGYGSGKG